MNCKRINVCVGRLRIFVSESVELKSINDPDLIHTRGSASECPPSPNLAPYIHRAHFQPSPLPHAPSKQMLDLFPLHPPIPQPNFHKSHHRTIRKSYPSFDYRRSWCPLGIPSYGMFRHSNYQERLKSGNGCIPAKPESDKGFMHGKNTESVSVSINQRLFIL